MNKINLEIVNRYLEALGADEYVLQLVPSDESQGKPMRGVVDKEAIIKQLAWLRLKNSQGYHIYCRPLGYQYVLIDDLTPESLASAKALSPCIIMETSPKNYQAWLHLPETPKNRTEALAICRELAERLGADRGSAEPDHVGRLAGFTNRKEKYRQGNVFPYVRLLHSKQAITSFSPVGGLCLKDVPPLSNGTMSSKPVKPMNGGSQGVEYDRSRADFNRACMLIRQGKTDEQIRQDLEVFSEKAKGRRDDYIGRTIQNARRVVKVA